MFRTPTLTIAIVAQNEAAALARLLPKLGWADEMLVVDGGSRDSTVATAERCGARVMLRNFDTFANQRNAALAAARGDWVLFVDADERPAAGFEDAVRLAIGSGRYCGLRTPIRSRIFGRPFRFSGTQDDRPVRLVLRSAARWRGEVHEAAQVDGPIGRLDAWLDHETLPNLTAFLAKMQLYTSLEATARVARGQAPRLRDLWLAPPREIARRLAYKHGWLDGPRGWAFCLLSGLSEWMLARKHRKAWRTRVPATPLPTDLSAT